MLLHFLKELAFSVLVLAALITLPCAEQPSALPTFESIGLYWSPSNGAENMACSVQYRIEGTSDWKKGSNLWYDHRSSLKLPKFPRATSEYRGSIVGLQPSTMYEIKLSLANGTTKNINIKTWNESFPEKTTQFQPEFSTAELTITASGTKDGYIVYAPSPDKKAVIDVKNTRPSCITVDASYIIIKGLTLRGGIKHGILFGENAHDVVIEHCDISGWGVIMNDGWGREHDAAIYGTSSKNGAIVVQRCRIRHPRSDANSWSEPRSDYAPAADGHPQGPQVIEFKNSFGNNVFRYNDIYSDLDHMFNDAIGGYDNGSYQGFPGPNSDVYGNIVMHCWDNPLEIEGGGMNVRVWGNYIDFGYTGIATIPVAVGPVYIFRNVCNKLFKNSAFDRSTRFFKSGFYSSFGDGRVFIYHNTMLQEFYKGKLMGGSCGIANTGILTNYITRNNIWYVFSSTKISINDQKNSDTTGSKANSFDYDLYNGVVDSKDPDKQKHGICAVPTWASDTINMYNPFFLKVRASIAPGTAGADAGEIINNFNDNYTGRGPDMGANEHGETMEFGIGAYSKLLPQHILFDELSPKKHGDVPFLISATGGNSKNPVKFLSSDTTVATISGNMVTITGAGETMITASQDGDSIYLSAPPVQRALIVKLDGYYLIKAKHSGLYIQADSVISQEKFTGAPSQIWKVASVGNAYEIYSNGLRQYLYYPDSAIGTKLSCTDSNKNRQFELIFDGNNTFFIRSVHGKKVVDVDKSSHAEKAPLLLRIRINEDNQRFIFLRPEEDAINYNFKSDPNTFFSRTGQFVLYPNCISGTVNLRVPIDNSSKARATVFDLSGKTVYTRMFDISHTEISNVIDLSRLKRNLYVIQIETGKGLVARKIVR